MSHHPLHRSLHLVDLDNLVSGPKNRADVPRAIDRYIEAARFEAGDHLVVAADASLATTAFFQMPAGSRLLIGRGPDGADNRLLEAAVPEYVATHYERLVICSGDHCFAQLARSARRLGVTVMAVAPQGSMSVELGRVSDHVRLLPSRIAAVAA